MPPYMHIYIYIAQIARVFRTTYALLLYSSYAQHSEVLASVFVASAIAVHSCPDLRLSFRHFSMAMWWLNNRRNTNLDQG